MITTQNSAVQAVAQPAHQVADKLDYSVVIEWENVLLADATRTVEMLRRLARQVAQVAAAGIKGETILVREADDVEIADELSRMLHATFGQNSDAVRVIGVRAKRYYEKKNEGAQQARGEIIVFLDSDVIPEERWLEGLLSAFSDPQVQVVAGATYIAPTTIYQTAFAAFWFFPPRSSAEGLAPARELFGNNIAFRREVFLANQFPVVPQFRGQAGMLIRDLRDRGFGIYLQRSSRCEHPPPSGFGHFVRRAMCDGHDNVIIARRTTGRSRLPWRYAYWSARSFVRSSFGGIRERHTSLRMSPLATATSVALTLSYVACMTFGEILTRLDPTLVPRRFSI
jgi:hypothetical protein